MKGAHRIRNPGIARCAIAHPRCATAHRGSGADAPSGDDAVLKSLPQRRESEIANVGGTRVMDSFDFIVVGGGSGGCGGRSRLSEDPATSVAVRGAGGTG